MIRVKSVVLNEGEQMAGITVVSDEDVLELVENTIGPVFAQHLTSGCHYGLTREAMTFLAEKLGKVTIADEVVTDVYCRMTWLLTMWADT